MNVILICSDTFRWDYLGCYGNDWIQTPNLDAMANESALYEHAFAEGLPTLPASPGGASSRSSITRSNPIRCASPAGTRSTTKT